MQVALCNQADRAQRADVERVSAHDISSKITSMP
jgi:hypothetical protein